MRKAKKEIGERNRSPKVTTIFNLESQLQPKLQLTHAASVEVVLDVGDLSGIAAAINASVALRAREPVNRMVEHVVGIHTELRSYTFSSLEILGQ